MEAIQVAPFVHHWIHWTPRQWLQILFGSIVLLPIRLFGLIFLLISYYFTVKILFRVFSGKIAGRLALLCFGQSVTQRGKFDPSARVLVSNHVSYLDIIWAQSAHCPALVAKQGVQQVPFIGTLARAWQCVWVGGALDGARGVGDASQLVTRVNSDDASLTPLLVFAEGTTTNGEYLLPFRTGAFVAGQPVQPVVLRYHSTLFSQGWETIPVWLHLLLSLSQWRTVLEVTYLPLYRPSNQERASAQLYADNVRRVMSERSVSSIHPRRLELSNATVREKRLFHQLIIKGVYSWRDPFESGVAVVPSGFSAK